jgi:hypothetical protein
MRPCECLGDSYSVSWSQGQPWGGACRVDLSIAGEGGQSSLLHEVLYRCCISLLSFQERCLADFVGVTHLNRHKRQAECLIDHEVVSASDFFINLVDAAQW